MVVKVLGETGLALQRKHLYLLKQLSYRPYPVILLYHLRLSKYLEAHLEIAKKAYLVWVLEIQFF